MKERAHSAPQLASWFLIAVIDGTLLDASHLYELTNRERRLAPVIALIFCSGDGLGAGAVGAALSLTAAASSQANESFFHVQLAASASGFGLRFG